MPHIGENEVLLVGDTQFAEAVAIGERCDRVHLVGGRVTRRHAGLLKRQRDHRVARHFVGEDITLRPVGERPTIGDLRPEALIVAGKHRVRRRFKKGR